MKLRPFLISLIVLGAAATEAPAPPPGKLKYPILPGYNADPSVRKWDGVFWAYPTNDHKDAVSWQDRYSFECFSSTDLVTWKNRGTILDVKDLSWGEAMLWAPDAERRNGKYYLYFSSDKKIGVAVADRAQGPFKDALGRPLITEETHGAGIMTFDPCVFIDNDDAPYLFYGGHGAVGMARLKDDMISFDEKIRRLPLENYSEGIHVFRRGDLYYFVYPHGIGEGKGRKQEMVYSTAESPYGPFTYRGAFLPARWRNVHGSVVEHDGRWFLFYHREALSWFVREALVSEFEFDADGLIRLSE